MPFYINLAIYINNTGFGDPNTLADFVQWGVAGSAREAVAVTAGIWTAGEFVEEVVSYVESILFFMFNTSEFGYLNIIFMINLLFYSYLNI